MNQEAIKQCKSILKNNHLHPIKKLGKGAFAIVFLVEKIQLQKSENSLYSVKCINKKQIIKRPSLNKYIKQQIQILRNIEHQNIVKSYRTFQDQGWIFMVMEYCDKGNLHTRVSESQSGVLSLEQTLYITWDVIKGLEYMHTKNLIHRDIKAENILLSSLKKKLGKTQSRKNLLSTQNLSNAPFEYLTKICDLGFTRQQNDQVNTFCGTTCYMAPQIFQKGNYDYKVDIWALGVLIFYMLFGDFPFKSLNIQYEIQKKCVEGFNISNINSIKPNSSISKQDFKLLEQFFKKIFTVKAEERLGLQQIKNFPLFKNMRANIGSLTMSVKQKSRQKLDRKSQKTTIESDSSEDFNNKGSLQKFQFEKYLFVKEIISEVQKQKFLKSTEQLAFKYYMLKMLFCEFEKSLQNLSKSQNEVKKELQELKRNLQKYSQLMETNISKISIPKFQARHFVPSVRNFHEFKQSYRLVIGHVFAKAHKSITQDVQIRSQLKLKLFICHVINRVFNSEFNDGVWAHFEQFRKNKIKPQLKPQNKQEIKQQSKPQQFNFTLLRKWISSQQPERLVQTVQLMNTKFYRAR